MQGKKKSHKALSVSKKLSKKRILEVNPINEKFNTLKPSPRNLRQSNGKITVTYEEISNKKNEKKKNEQKIAGGEDFFKHLRQLENKNTI